MTLLPINACLLYTSTIAAVSVWAVVYFKGKNGKKFRQGEEYGSARWGNEKDIAPFIDPVFENNILLTQTERLTMNSRPKKPKYARNKNVIVIGGSVSIFIRSPIGAATVKDMESALMVAMVFGVTSPTSVCCCRSAGGSHHPAFAHFQHC